jgi:hypothetical protein
MIPKIGVNIWSGWLILMGTGFPCGEYGFAALIHPTTTEAKGLNAGPESGSCI